MTALVQPTDFIAYVHERGYQVEPLLNTGEIEAFGVRKGHFWHWANTTGKQSSALCNSCSP